MSSRGSVAITLELPARTTGERASRVLAVLAVLAAGWVSARYPGTALPWAITAIAAVALWVAGARPRDLRALAVQPGGRWRVEGPGGRRASAIPGPGTRRLGPTVVLDVRADATARSLGCRLWLTPADLPAATLRRLAVRLPVAGRKTGS
jgi:hypothetical protein